MKLLIIHFGKCCGGIGDRIVGLVSAIILAKYMNRELKIKWDYPNINNVFKVPLLYTKNISKDMISLNTIDAPFKYQTQFSKFPLKKLWFQKDIVLKCNQNIARFVYVNPHFITDDYETEMIQTYRRIFNEFLIPQQSIIKNMPSEVYVGIQFRTGDQYMNVSKNHKLVKNIETKIENIVEFALSHLPEECTCIYISSDNKNSLPIFKDVIGKKTQEIKVFYNDESSVHFEKSNAATDKLNLLINDIRILSRASTLFISTYSNYGRLAVLMNNNFTHFGFDHHSDFFTPIDIQNLFSKHE